MRKINIPIECLKVIINKTLFLEKELLLEFKEKNKYIIKEIKEYKEKLIIEKKNNFKTKAKNKKRINK